MDEKRFDALSRRAARALDRRGLLHHALRGGLLAALTGMSGLLAAMVEAKGGKKGGKQGGKGGKKGKGTKRQAGSTQPPTDWARQCAEERNRFTAEAEGFCSGFSGCPHGGGPLAKQECLQALYYDCVFFLNNCTSEATLLAAKSCPGGDVRSFWQTKLQECQQGCAAPGQSCQGQTCCQTVASQLCNSPEKVCCILPGQKCQQDPEACCHSGTICASTERTGNVPRCCTDTGQQCQHDFECCHSYNTCPQGHCCGKTHGACHPNHPEGCCNGYSCPSDTLLCCANVSTACEFSEDCCGDLRCCGEGAGRKCCPADHNCCPSGSEHRCCPPTHPSCVEENAFGVTCCRAGMLPCLSPGNTGCCSVGKVCVGGDSTAQYCCPDTHPVRCGPADTGWCCQNSICGTSDNKCGCPADRPVHCGTGTQGWCCPSGAPCGTADNQCRATGCAEAGGCCQTDDDCCAKSPPDPPLFCAGETLECASGLVCVEGEWVNGAGTSRAANAAPGADWAEAVVVPVAPPADGSHAADAGPVKSTASAAAVERRAAAGRHREAKRTHQPRHKQDGGRERRRTRRRKR